MGRKADGTSLPHYLQHFLQYSWWSCYKQKGPLIPSVSYFLLIKLHLGRVEDECIEGSECHTMKLTWVLVGTHLSLGVNILFPFSLDFDRVSSHEHLGGYCLSVRNKSVCLVNALRNSSVSGPCSCYCLIVELTMKCASWHLLVRVALAECLRREGWFYVS